MIKSRLFTLVFLSLYLSCFSQGKTEDSVDINLREEQQLITERIKSKIISNYKADSIRMSLLHGKTLPDFIYKSLAGTLVSSLDLKGIPMLLYLWHPNSQDCINEIPYLNDIKESVQQKVHFIAMADDSSYMLEKYVQQYSFNYIQIPEADLYLELFGQLPKILIIDAEGNIDGIYNKILKPESIKPKSPIIQVTLSDLIDRLDNLN